MSNAAFNALEDAGIELCEARSQLTLARDAGVPDNATAFRRHALNKIRTMRRHLERASKAIERELYEPNRP